MVNSEKKTPYKILLLGSVVGILFNIFVSVVPVMLNADSDKRLIVIPAVAITCFVISGYMSWKKIKEVDDG